MIQLLTPPTRPNSHPTTNPDRGTSANNGLSDSPNPSDRGLSASEGVSDLSHSQSTHSSTTNGAPAPIPDNRRPEGSSNQPPSSSNPDSKAAPTTPRGGDTPPTPAASSSTSSLRDSVSSSLLADYLYGSFDLAELAFNHNLKMDELRNILRSEEFRSRVDDLRELSRQQAEDVLICSLPKAARELVQIATFNPADGSLHGNRVRYLERECTRKASTAILKPLLTELRHKGRRTQSEPLPSPPLQAGEGAGKAITARQRMTARKKAVARREHNAGDDQPHARSHTKRAPAPSESNGASAPSPVPDGGGLGRGSK